MAKKDKDVQEEQAGGGKKKLIIIIAAVLLIAGAVFAYLWFKTPLIGPDPNASDQPSAQASATNEPPMAEKTVNIDSITVNLAGNTGFLKIGVSVQFGADVDQSIFSTSAINDEIIQLYSRLNVTELADPAVKELAKVRLTERLNELYGKDSVTAVYYTEFVTQSV